MPTWEGLSGVTVIAPRSLVTAIKVKALFSAGNVENTCPFTFTLPHRKRKQHYQRLRTQRKQSLSGRSDAGSFKASGLMITSNHLKCLFQKALSAILAIVTKINVIIPLLQIRKIGMVST